MALGLGMAVKVLVKIRISVSTRLLLLRVKGEEDHHVVVIVARHIKSVEEVGDQDNIHSICEIFLKSYFRKEVTFSCLHVRWR